MREIGAMTDMSETDTSIQAVPAEDPLPLEPLLLIGEITRTSHLHDGQINLLHPVTVLSVTITFSHNNFQNFLSINV